MEHLLLLFQQLKQMDETISLFYGQTIIQPTLNRMLRNRRRHIKKITAYQLRYFNRD